MRPEVECIHHWDLAAPYRGTVHGICRKCEAEKDYPSGLFAEDLRFGYVQPEKRMVPKRHAQSSRWLVPQ